MKPIFFLTFLIGLATLVTGQTTDKKLQKQIDSLRKSGIDTFLIYSFTCNEGVSRLDTCAFDEPEYLFWMQEKNYFIMKFDDCKNYKSIILDTINPLSFFIKFKNIITKEQIRRPSYIQSKNSNIEMTSMIDHDCFYKMTYQLRRKSVIKKISDYNLTFKNFDNGKMNRFYTYNQSTKLKVLISQLTQLIEQLTTGGKFETQ
jgi:hypothetical protein